MLDATAEACSDGIDNDQDGYTDCTDFDCLHTPGVEACGVQENSDTSCSNDQDDDGDGQTDCDDWGCFENPWVTVCGNPCA